MPPFSAGFVVSYKFWIYRGMQALREHGRSLYAFHARYGHYRWRKIQAVGTRGIIGCVLN